jgi:hypothetical protein
LSSVPYKFIFNFVLKSSAVYFLKSFVILIGKLGILLELSYILGGRSFLLKVLNNSHSLASLVRDSKDYIGCCLKRVLSFEDSLVVLIS